MTFIGCNKSFCRDHGYPHFSGLMINPTKINQESQFIHDAEEKEELEERIKFANKDRSSNIPFHISEIRVCESCYDDF